MYHLALMLSKNSFLLLELIPHESYRKCKLKIVHFGEKNIESYKIALIFFGLNWFVINY